MDKPQTPAQTLDCESRLKLAESRLETMSSQTERWMWETDENHRFVFFTDNVAQLTGLRQEDLLGTSRLEMALSSDDPSWKNHAETLKKQRPFKEFKYVRKTVEGNDRYLVITGWPLFDEGGLFSGYRGTAWDESSQVVSGRRQVEKEENLLYEIEKQRTNLSTVLENLSQSVMWFDEFGVIRLNNAQTPKLLGFSDEEYSRVHTLQHHLRLMAERGDFGDVDIEKEVESRTNRLCLEQEETIAYRIHLQATDRYLDIGLRPLPDGSRILTHTDVTVEARKDRKLQEREAMLSTVIDNVDYGILFMDEDLNCDVVNQRFAEMWEMDQKFIAKKPRFVELMEYNRHTGLYDVDGNNDEEWDDYVRVRENIVKNSEAKTIEIARADGRFFNFSTTKLPGNRRMATYFDITELKEMELALREANEGLEFQVQELNQREAVLNSLVNNIDYGTLVLDRDRKVELANKKFRELMSIDAAFLEHSPTMSQVLDRMYDNKCTGLLSGIEEEWPHYRESVIEQIGNGEFLTAERERQDGKIILSSCLKLPGGRRLVTYFDMTEHRKGEAALVKMQNDLQLREEMLSTVINKVDQGILLMDADLNVEIGNQKFAELWGMEMEFFDHSPSFRDIMDHNRHTGFYPVDGNDNDAWNEYAHQRVASIRAGAAENLEFVRGDGKTLIFSVVNLPGGRRMTTYFDVSELKEREAQLKAMQNDLAQANELLEERVEQRTKELRQTQNRLVKNERQALLGDLVASLCHELRNPLNALNTSLFLIRRNVESDFPKLTRAFDRSERTIKRCTNILNDLFDYALVDELKKETVTFSSWLQGVVDIVEIPKSFEVNLDIDEELPACEIDPVQMGGGVGKIIANAAQAVADAHDPTANPKIEIYAGDCGDYIEVIISDNGPGMDDETFARALEPLFSTRGFGVGLGLPIAEQVIKRHGGDIRLETFEGAGTTVTIWLPALDQPLLQVA